MSDRQWLKSALQFRGSVIPVVLRRSVGCGVFTLGISFLHQLGWKVHLPFLVGIIPNIVLGLLLVFRTNTAYDRYWEGRKCWGSITNSSRNLARQIWVAVDGEGEHRATKVALLKLIVAFALSVKDHLRQPVHTQVLESSQTTDEPPPSPQFWGSKTLTANLNSPRIGGQGGEKRGNEVGADLCVQGRRQQESGPELLNLLSTAQVQRRSKTDHLPLQIAYWISDALQTLHRQNRLDVYQLTALQAQLNQLVDALGGCERILKTPMPLAYAIHLKQLLMLYCLSLPFQVVGNLGWWSALVVVLISFTLFGIEAIGLEIENPFGNDPNDLPLDAICANIASNIDELIQAG
jgi:ion channel-forming bestrophin family protein